MQEKIAIKISPVGLHALMVKAAERESIILNELLVNKKKIEDMLMSYYFKSRGRVYDVRIEKPILIKDSFEGFFNLTYSVGHFNACADVDTHEDEKMVVTLNLNLKNAEAILIGEYFQEREPDEF